VPVEVVPVRGRRAFSRFIGLPWRLVDRGRYPGWIPPLRASVADTLDRKANPFYQEADREIFLAWDGGRPVGRIAAIHNRRHNAFHEDRVGFFGFFESVDDPAVASALLDAASGWLEERGLDRLRGPVSPSTNHECGLLVDGFESHTTFMTSWNPPWYGPLLENAGLEKAKDLLGFWVPIGEGGFALTERWQRIADRARARERFQFSVIVARDIERAWDVYNAAWERNWGFVPMARAEFDYMAGQMKPLLVDEFVNFVQVDGETVGLMMSMPDYNLTMKRVPSGRLLFALPRLLLDRGRLRRGRLMMLGVKERFRGRGAYLVFLDEAIRRARAYGVEGIEASWILEDNHGLLGIFEQTGLAPSKRWRIYERAIPHGRA
jgi:hypothetical protein